MKNKIEDGGWEDAPSSSMSEWEDAPNDGWEDAEEEDLPSQIPGVQKQQPKAPDPSALDYLRGGVDAAAGLVSGAVMMVPGMAGLAVGGKKGFEKVMEQAYKPRTELGQDFLEDIVNSEPMRMLEAFPATHSVRAAILGTDTVARAIPRKFSTEQIKEAVRLPKQEARTPPIQQEIPGLTATEGIGPQQSLFDIPESGRVPMQYEAVPGDWRIDENNIPVKVGESLDVQHSQTPLQRDLWVDQTPEFATMQEGQLSIPQALDTMSPEARAQAIRQSGLDQGSIESPELAAAKLEADSYMQPATRSGSPSLLDDSIVVSGPSRGPGLPQNTQPTSLAKYEAPVQAIERNIPGVRDRLKEIGDSLIESPEQAIDLATKSTDVNQNFLQKASNYLTKGGIYLKTRVKNPVISYAVDEFVKADSLIRGKVSEKVQGQYLKNIRDLSNAEFTKMADILNTADLNKRAISPQEMDAWGMSPKEKQVVQMHQQLMREAFTELNTVRETLGKKPLAEREGYSAMSMHGDFRKLVTILDENGNPVTVGAIGATTKKKLDKIEKMLMERHPEYEFSQMQTVGQRSYRGSPASAFMDVLKTIGEDNPRIGEFVNELNELAKSDPSTFMGMDRHTLAKKGVFGMEGRKPWETPSQNAKDFFENQVRYLEGVYQWSELSKAAMNLNKVIHDPKVMANHPNAVALAERYMTNALGLEPLVSGRAVDEVLTTWLHNTGIGSSIARESAQASRLVANSMMLAFKPVFYLANMIQPNIAIPQIASILKSTGQDVGSMFGTDAIIKASNTALKARLGKPLTPVESGALAYAKKHNIYSTDLVEHSRNPRKSMSYRASEVSQWIPGKIESLTRGQVYLSIVHMLDKSGLKPKDGLYQQAQRFTDMAMNNYSYLEQPLVYKGLGMFGSLAYNLKSFGHNELSRWSMVIREMGEHKEAKPLLTAMATTIAFAGVFGLPFYAQFEDLYNYITEKLGKPRRLTLDIIEANKALGQHLSDKGQFVLSNGLFSSLGVDLSKNIGLGDVVPNEPGALGFAGANIFGDVAKGIGGVATNPTSPEHWKALAYAGAPTAVQGMLDTKWYQRGDLAYSKDPSKSPAVTVQRTELDTLFRKLGMYGIHERTAKTKAYEEKMLNDSITTYRTKALEKIGNDLFENRPITQKTLDQYFIAGQGDAKELMQGIEKRAIAQQVPPQVLQQIKLQATKSIPQLMRAEREMNAVTAKPAFGFGQ